MRRVRETSQAGPCATAAKCLCAGVFCTKGARRGFGKRPRTPGLVSFFPVLSAISLSALAAQ
eukprot:5641543-Pyramimonas_sp.AAC.1